MRIDSHGISDIGRVRDENEDAFLIDREHSVFAVADGLGGLPEGALASKTTISILEKELRQRGVPDNFKALFERMNLEVVLLGRRISPDTGIGTTMTAAVVRNGRVEIVHIGDSAVYRFRADGVEKLTTDHTLEEEIRSRPGYNPLTPIPRRHSHVLTRCLGQIENMEYDRYVYPVDSGDRLLLCTDGITLSITPEEIHPRMLAAKDPETFTRELIDLANERGGRDNATAITVFID